LLNFRNLKNAIRENFQVYNYKHFFFYSNKTKSIKLIINSAKLQDSVNIREKEKQGGFSYLPPNYLLYNLFE
jgi:hypothetical protein